jgi:hypothetical protein
VNYGDSLDGCLSVQTRETCDDGEPLADFNFRPGARHVNYGDSLDGFYIRPGARNM